MILFTKILKFEMKTDKKSAIVSLGISKEENNYINIKNIYHLLKLLQSVHF